MIIAGVVLVILGLLLGVGWVVLLGLALVVIGALLELGGRTGRVGRRYW